MVRERGLEPLRPKTQVPKTCVSANSTTPARSAGQSYGVLTKLEIADQLCHMPSGFYVIQGLLDFARWADHEG